MKAILLFLMLSLPAFAQHPPEHEQLHTEFYSKWKMPNAGSPRLYSCCNNEDCYPTPIKYENGQWWALKRETQAWVLVPESKLEQFQDDVVESPDFLSHACIGKYNDMVYCATLGVGN